MAEQPTQAAAQAPERQPTEAELKAELQAALDSGDFKVVTAVSRKIDQLQKTAEKAELEAKRAAAEGVGKKVLGLFLKAVKPMLDTGELDAFDGIWITHDFGEKDATVRLMKTTARAPRAGGGGGGKKFDVSTDSMLAKYGEEPYKESGMTFKQAYDSNTDKNFRYAIRQALLKKDGII